MMMRILQCRIKVPQRLKNYNATQCRGKEVFVQCALQELPTCMRYVRTITHHSVIQTPHLTITANDIRWYILCCSVGGSIYIVYLVLIPFVKVKLGGRYLHPVIHWQVVKAGFYWCGWLGRSSLWNGVCSNAANNEFLCPGGDVGMFVWPSAGLYNIYQVQRKNPSTFGANQDIFIFFFTLLMLIIFWICFLERANSIKYWIIK